jgi:hypothetical protein
LEPEGKSGGATSSARVGKLKAACKLKPENAVATFGLNSKLLRDKAGGLYSWTLQYLLE